jgi:23S rRNA (uracil1939-C5)-methyltransferase
MARKKKVYPDVTITGIADKGQAVGRDEEGVVYFVQGAVPGDVVDVLVLRKKSSYRKGIVKAFKKYSDERVQPFCEHFGMCGGCKWQDLSYKSQLHYKEQVVLDAFSRLGHIEIRERRPIIGCASSEHYRNKMEYTFSSRRWVSQEELDTQEDVNFGQAVGFFKAGQFDKIVPIKKCHLQEDLTNEIRNYINEVAIEKEWTYYNIREHHGFLRNLRIRNATTGEWMVIVVFAENNEEDIHYLMNDIKSKFPQITSLSYIINKKYNDTINDQEVINFHGKEWIEEKLGHIKYQIGPKSFFQTNTNQAKALYDQIVEIADLQKEDLVYDLYTGLGSIALYIADKCKTVIGIEEIKEAIDDANLNKDLNNIDNAYFEVGDVKDQFNGHFIKKYGPADVIIVDPPRPGLHPDVVQTLHSSDVPKILYVSCNPSTQARDISMLSDKYKVDIIQPVDMFPHTHHIENIALLIKK